jgi:uncharacterized membrane protein
MDDVILAGGQALNGLLAGIYLAFVVAVMPALHGLPDDTFRHVMNRINVVIVNPAFLTFLGAPVLAVILAAVQRGYETPWVRWHYVRTGAAIVAFGLLCNPATT